MLNSLNFGVFWSARKVMFFFRSSPKKHSIQLTSVLFCFAGKEGRVSRTKGARKQAMKTVVDSVLLCKHPDVFFIPGHFRKFIQSFVFFVNLSRNAFESLFSNGLCNCSFLFLHLSSKLSFQKWSKQLFMTIFCFGKFSAFSRLFFKFIVW